MAKQSGAMLYKANLLDRKHFQTQKWWISGRTLQSAVRSRYVCLYKFHANDLSNNQMWC